MSANETQVGGSHYKMGERPEHWDLVSLYNWDYFQGQITKYLMRWKFKHKEPHRRLEDLQKAQHFLQKYIEVEQDRMRRENTLAAKEPDSGYGMQARMWAGHVKEPEKPKASILTPLDPHMNRLAFNDEVLQCEGYYGDGTELYVCRQCRAQVRAPGLTSAHLSIAHGPGCTLAPPQAK